MSKLGKFFKGGGSSKSRAAPSPQEALARLRETEEMLGKKQEYLENRIQRELALAKKHGKQNKRGRLGSGPRARTLTHLPPALPLGTVRPQHSSPAGGPDELMAELEELEQEELNKKMTNMRLPNVPPSSLPAQPDRKPSMPSAARRSRAASSRRAEEEDDDFKQLAAWAT
ncbi:PREDICTED: charged multivesicular body protein 4c [Propithecus coquereli]|uniref:charged multivesicular body protein 4c n=1 Tax=Propithecus coquereli TaxID=379532 RepID=UPI00063FBC42|nr:PREDICTED: charged multivesicular body protein 4c [Propithecus coquereli]